MGTFESTGKILRDFWEADHGNLPEKKRMRFFEEMAANAHVALHVMQYDGWLLHFSNGYTNRANSVSVLYPSEKPAEEKIAYCEACYARQGLPTVFKLTYYDGEIMNLLSERGYESVTPTDVMELSLEGLSSEDAWKDCVFSKGYSDWLTYYFEFEALTDEGKKETFRQMLSKVKVEPVYGTVAYGGNVIACASLAIEQGYALLQNVVVKPGMRGQGFGEKLCRAMIAKARGQGASHVYLQVVQANQPAMNLYKKLGFQKIYTYWYMKKS